MSEQRRFSGDLDEDEIFWRDHVPWLKERGYQLRPRYQPGWEPSWRSAKGKSRFDFEDGCRAQEPVHLMDAIRLSDRLGVMLKKLRVPDLSNPTREMRLNQMLSSGTLPLDTPQNHCVPIYEILKVPNDDDQYIVVMAMLDHWWPYGVKVPFATIGEAVGFMRQIFEGVQFLHHRHIAHNDIKWNNIQADSAPRYRRRLHPIEPGTSYDWKSTVLPRSITRHPVKYYFIDFGSAKEYDPQYPALEIPGYGGDRTVPEFTLHPDKPCDPLPVEIYRLGNLIRTFLMSTQGVVPREELVEPPELNPALNFLSELVADMVQDDPTKRPDIDQVVERFDEIVKGLGFFKLRSQFWPRFSSESWFYRTLWKTPRHFVSQMINFIGRYPPIPPVPGPPKGRKGW